MEKTELGFQTTLNLKEASTLNFCFRNNNNEWDNNDGKNYIFPIEKVELALVPTEDSFLDAPRKLRKTYLWSKKIRLSIYKIITYIPKLISGNFKRKISE